MRGDDPPAIAEAHPGLHLAAELAGLARPVEQCRGDRAIAAVGGDYGARQAAPEPGRRAGAAERLDLGMAVQVLAAAVADGAWIIAEQGVELGHVVRHQRPLVA